MDLSGELHPQYLTCLPNPCTECLHWATHDVGNCELTVTDQGILGFMDGSQGEGDGFIYPAGGDNLLYIGGLWVGIEPDYVASRDYDADPDVEWSQSVVPLGCIWIDETGTSDQDIHASYNDSAATSPRGLLVDQESRAYGGSPTAPSFVIVCYTLRNASTTDLLDLYPGVFLDLDFTAQMHSVGGVDAALNLAYMADTTGVHAGVCLLQDDSTGVGSPPLANLSIVHNPTYVFPNEYVLDEDKYAFLAGSDSAHVVTSATEEDDYSLVASAGPIDLAPGEERLVAFALVAGEDLIEVRQLASAAWMTYLYGSAQYAYIPNVPDANQPPTNTITTNVTNFCAPMAAVNITEYWDAVMGHPSAVGVNAGLGDSTAAEYIGHFMDTNNNGSPARWNGTNLRRSPRHLCGGRRAGIP